MKAGIDNYGLYPLGLSPLQTLEWAVRHGAEGVAFSGIDQRSEQKLDAGLLKAIRDYASEHDLYLEWGGGQHLPVDMTAYTAREIFSMNRVVIEEAALLGAGVVRSCSGGLMRWHHRGPSTEDYLELMGNELRKIVPVLQDLDVVWAIETHFEFTSFELLRLFEKNHLEPDGPIGICLDTMNLLTMLEDPVRATRRLLPWIRSTHMKDGGLVQYPDGMKSYPAPIGEGWIRLDEIIRLLQTEHPDIHLNLEDHNGSFHLPVYDQDFTNQFPDLDPDEWQSLSEMACASHACREKAERLYFDRGAWPRVCESRMASGLLELKQLRDRMQNETF